MKPTTNILPRILFILLLSLLLPLKGLAQCANITITTTKQDSPCSNNGQITVLVTGDDIDNGKYFDLQYRVYRPGIDPELWVDENTHNNLVAGTYKIDIRGKCQEAGGGYVEVPNAAPAVTIIQGDWQAVNIRAEKTRSSFECIDPNGGGQVTFSKASGGTGPYTLKIISAPATYTGITEKTFTTVASINNSTWDNLTAGTYIFELSESSICHSTATATVSVPTLATQLPNLFQYAYPGQRYDSSKNDTLYHKAFAVSRVSLSTTTDYPYYLNNLNGKVEFTYYHPIDGVPTASDYPNLNWKSMPTTNLGMILLDSMKYTVDEVVADVNKRPVILVRILTGTCAGTVQSMTYTLRTPYGTANQTVVDCDKQRYGLRPWTDYDGVFTWPVTLSVHKRQADNTYLLVEQLAPISYSQSSSYSYFTNYLDNGSYKYTITSALGTDYSTTFTLNATTPVSNSYIYNNRTLGCEFQEEIPYITIPVKGITNVKLLKVEKRVEGAPYEEIDVDTEPGFTPPTFKEWNQSDLPVGYTSTSGNLSFWKKNKSEAVTITSNVYTKDNSNFINVGTQSLTYRYSFQVTDTCGNIATKMVNSNEYYYEYADPQISATADCYNDFDLRIPNVSNILKRRGRSVPSSNNPTNVTAYVRIIDGPSGGYDTGSNSYISSPSQSLKMTKPGTYTVGVYYTSYFTKSDTCVQSYPLEIRAEDTAFELDGNLTAAYRCQNSALGDGYIKLAVKNGSGGPYTFELYQYDNTLNDFISIETNTTGEFQNWLEKNSDSYKVRVTDSGCATVRSFEQKLDVMNLSNVPISWVENYNICPGGTIKLHALALGNTTYQWTGPNGWTSTDKDPIITNVGPEHSGIYTVTVTIPFCGGETMAGSVTASVGIPTLYWNPAATDGNWFNANNWLLADGTTAFGHPSPCTTVHIPGNADHYPNLSKDHSPWSLNGQPACDTIVYHYGGETTYPSHLLYNRAIVQYNWGYYDTNPADGTQPTLHKDTSFPANGTRTIPQLSRGRWNMLSAPLKNMTGGDFNLGGTPTTYQRLYNIQNPTQGIYPQGTSGHTQPFEKYNIDLSTVCNALAVAIVPYKNNTIGSGDHTHLQATQGIMEMPYILNLSQDAHRPLHTYNTADSTSTFTYYNIETLAPIAGQEDKIQRGYQSYRFVYEQADNKPEKTVVGSDNISIYRMPLVQPHTGNKIMIGNPLMSHIDFDKLYALNTSVISNRYEIVEATTGNTLTYEIGGSNNGTMTKNIPPLQAFIVERLNPTATEDLIFHLDGTSSVITFGSLNDALPKPRNLASQTPQSWIHIQSQAQDTLTKWINKDAIRLLIGSDDNINTYKTMKTEDIAQKAEILLIGQDGNWYSDLNQKNTQGTEKYILGVLSTTTQPITLDITPGGDQIKQVQLIDKYLNTTTDVTKGGQYTFNQRLGWFTGGREGMDINRFELIITLK